MSETPQEPGPDAEVPANPMAAQHQPAAAVAGAVDAAEVEEALRDVIDPELGINVVDLGLLYGVNIEPDGAIVLDMTLTTAACPLTDVIEEQAQQALVDLSHDVRVQWVWLPPWGPDKITPEGREQLRALGFNV
ncbi:FeS assembly SUF system protein [Actinomyces bovis]|uniref:FeS assembly SUF system protein n=1 Tax=Actinomyces bovis TaxID=1658 RepID=A0ABY1VQF8_9ACTO|nr:FeS assembly SUF system protein [Actinomyces bovis]VEG53577.1 FeS assembly SUF system protein [Actinomyces israelii]